MEDGEGERKTKTISFTVYEDVFDAPVEAVLNALFNHEMEGRCNCSRIDAVSSTLVNAVLDLGEDTWSQRKVDGIMFEAARKQKKNINMEDDDNEENAKTISLTVKEDTFDAGVLAVIDALIDRELEDDKRVSERRVRRGESPINNTRLDVLNSVLFAAVITFAEMSLGDERVDEIMGEGMRKYREMTESVNEPPEPSGM